MEQINLCLFYFGVVLLMQLIFRNGLTRNSNFFSACTIEIKIYMRHLQNEALNLTFSSCLFSSRWVLLLMRALPVKLPCKCSCVLIDLFVPTG